MRDRESYTNPALVFLCVAFAVLLAVIVIGLILEWNREPPPLKTYIVSCNNGRTELQGYHFSREGRSGVVQICNENYVGCTSFPPDCFVQYR